MRRREFHAMAAAFGLGIGEDGSAIAAGTSGAGSGTIESFVLPPHDWVPNNPHLPVILYRGALPVGGDDPAAAHEALFARHGWPPQWRNGVYPFHHYHTEGHEVLGFVAGSARLMLGGPGGREVVVQGGDVVLLPAGTGHMNLGSDDAFSVVGAYPPGQGFDIVRQSPDAAQRARLLGLPHPASDPVAGIAGPVARLWRA